MRSSLSSTPPFVPLSHTLPHHRVSPGESAITTVTLSSPVATIAPGVKDLNEIVDTVCISVIPSERMGRRTDVDERPAVIDTSGRAPNWATSPDSSRNGSEGTDDNWIKWLKDGSLIPL